MPLCAFLDIVWAEVWDDCGPMSDQTQYRSIVTQLFLEGKDPTQVTYTVTDAKGKTKVKRLSEGQPLQYGVAPAASEMAKARDMYERLQQMREAARLQSAGNAVLD